MAQDTLVTGSKLTAIANAIRTKGGTQAQLTLDQMPQAVADIPTGGGGFDWSQITSGIKIMTMSNNYSLDLHGMDTSTFKSMFEMFATGFNYYLTSVDMSSCDTRQVTDMRRMFIQCTNLRSANLAGCDTANVTTMNQMFCQCSNLWSVNLAKLDTTKLTASSSVGQMFDRCSSLQAIIWATDKTTVQAFPTDMANVLPSYANLYVPDDLLSAYKSETNYSTVAERIFGISDLPQEFKTLYGIS